MQHDDDKYLTPKEVAKLLMVSPAAVRLWAEKGELKALTTPGGHRRFLQSDVDRFTSERGHRVNNLAEHKLSILIVDDDVQFTNYLQKLLSKFSSDVEVNVANNGFDAGIRIKELEPDIVLLDLMMPGMDGFTVCESIKSNKTTAAIRIIVMTGFPSAENVQKVMSAGAEVCLSKPVNKEELLSLLGLHASID